MRQDKKDARKGLEIDVHFSDEELKEIKKQVQDMVEIERNKQKAFSKRIMRWMFFICIQILAFAEFMMWYTQDLSALYVLIGVPASLAVGIWQYSVKSAKENTKGGITYEMAMLEAMNTAMTEPDGDEIDFDSYKGENYEETFNKVQN